MSVNFISISQTNLSHNLSKLSTMAGGLERLCPVIKGNAYGHGAREMAMLLVDMGVQRLAVVSAQEAEEVYECIGGVARILVIGYCSPAEVAALPDTAELVLIGEGQLEQLSSVHRAHPLEVYLQVDSGMHRYGVHPEHMIDCIDKVEEHQAIHLLGLCSHFANAWNEDTSYASAQLQTMAACRQRAAAHLGRPLACHLDNSAGLMMLDTGADFVRCGIATYGYFPSVDMYRRMRQEVDLRPILSFSSAVAHVHDISAGEGVGYDLAYQYERDGRYAIVPVGYDDGFPFAHSGSGAKVLIAGRRVSVIGRVNMNCIILDVTKEPDVKVGDSVTILGVDGEDQITIYDWMDWGANHLYEALTKLRVSLPKRIVD